MSHPGGRVRAASGRASQDRSAAPSLRERAAASGWRLTSRTRMFLDDLDQTLDPDRRQRVAVLAGPRGSPVGDLLASHPGRGARHLFSAGREDLHLALTAAGPFDLIVDDTPPGPGHADLFRATFPHLRRGGTFLIRHAGPAAGDDVADMLGSLTSARLSRPPRRRRPASPDARLATNVAAITLRGRHMAVRARATARVKLREDEAADLIRRRGPGWGTTLSTRPAATLRNRATVRESPNSHGSAVLPAVLPAPVAALRAYRDVTCAPGQIAWRGNVILSDSFRHNARPAMHNKNLDNLSALFARTPEAVQPVERLDGAYFYLDSESRGHYGHALTEQLSRLWAWREAKAAFPDLKALMLVRNRELAAFEPVLYAAAGIDPEDLIVPGGTVEVDTLVAATPMFSQPEYVHPDLPAFWQQVGEALADRAPDLVYPTRIFCSRRQAKRACTNAAAVEHLFTSHGFEVIYPEDYPLTAQSRMFRDADVIAGYAGSAMFTTALTGRPKHVILVASESYTARNEHLIAAALGHRLDVAWCVSQRPKVRPGFDRASFHAPYTFDMDREGAWLRWVLAEYPGRDSSTRAG